MSLLGLKTFTFAFYPVFTMFIYMIQKCHLVLTMTALAVPS